MTATKALEVSTLTNSDAEFKLLSQTESYVNNVLYRQISFAASTGRRRMVHILPKGTISRLDAARMLIEEDYTVTLIGRLLIAKW